MGYTEVLYVTEMAGLILTWLGYRMSVRLVVLPGMSPAHSHHPAPGIP